MVVDARGPVHETVRAILERASVGHDVFVVASPERAADSVASERRTAVLIHAGVQPRLGTPPLGPLLASLCHAKSPEARIMLYTGGNVARHERALAQQGLTTPVVNERRLADSFDSIVADLYALADAEAALRGSTARLPKPQQDTLPQRFSIDRFLGAVEGAFSRVALLEHGNTTEAAAAVRIPHDRFVDHLTLHDVEVPRGARTASVSRPRLLWCSDRPPQPQLATACDEQDLCVRVIPPGTLHPGSVHSPLTIAALAEPACAGSAADLWVLQRSVRPFVIVGDVPAPVRFILEELEETPHAWVPVAGLPPSLVDAGRRALNLFRDMPLDQRARFRSSGVEAWPLDVPALRQRLEGRVLRLARSTSDSLEAAARAVGLTARTFRRRLRAANLRDAARRSG